MCWQRKLIHSNEMVKQNGHVHTYRENESLSKQN